MRERKAIDLAHLVKSRVERSRPLAHDDDDVRKLVQHDRRDGGGFGQTEPEIAKDRDDQGWRVQEQDQPGIDSAIGRRTSAERDARDAAGSHGDEEGGENTPEGHADIDQQVAAARLRRDGGENVPGRRQGFGGRDHGDDLPCRHQHDHRPDARCHLHERPFGESGFRREPAPGLFCRLFNGESAPASPRMLQALVTKLHSGPACALFSAEASSSAATRRAIPRSRLTDTYLSGYTWKQ